MKILLVMLVLFIGGIAINAQPTDKTPPELRDIEFAEVGRSEKFVYMIDTKNIVRKDPFVTLSILQAHYKLNEGATTYALNNIAYIVISYRVNCKNDTGVKLSERGFWLTKPINIVYKTFVPIRRQSVLSLGLAMDAVCPSTVEIPITNTDG